MTDLCARSDLTLAAAERVMIYHDTAVSVTEEERNRSSPSKMTGSAIGTRI